MCYTLKPKVSKFQLSTPSPFPIKNRVQAADVDRDLLEFKKDTSYFGEGYFGKIVLDCHNGNLLVAVKMFKENNMSD